jgi:hypothetical protein
MLSPPTHSELLQMLHPLSLLRRTGTDQGPEEYHPQGAAWGKASKWRLRSHLFPLSGTAARRCPVINESGEFEERERARERENDERELQGKKARKRERERLRLRAREKHTARTAREIENRERERERGEQKKASEGDRARDRDLDCNSYCSLPASG